MASPERVAWQNHKRLIGIPTNAFNLDMGPNLDTLHTGFLVNPNNAGFWDQGRLNSARTAFLHLTNNYNGNRDTWIPRIYRAAIQNAPASPLHAAARMNASAFLNNLCDRLTTMYVRVVTSHGIMNPRRRAW